MPRTDDSSPWLAQWQDAGARIAKAVDPVVADSWPSGLGVASTLLARVPAGSTLFTGSSNSVRDLDLAMAPEKVAADLAVVASRGLAGIDGSVSTAVGVALSEPDRPSYALMGDLTFLHDTNGLLIGPREPRADLTIVVVNDDGGGIFTLLEPGDPVRAHDFERIFGTATGARVIDICRAHGVRHTLAETRHALAEAVAARPQGIHVVEVAVDRSAHRGWHESLRAAAATALA